MKFFMDAIFVYFCSVQFRFFYGYVQYSYNFTTSSMKILDDVSFFKFIDMFVFLIFYLHFSHFHSNVGSMSTRILGGRGSDLFTAVSQHL